MRLYYQQGDITLYHGNTMDALKEMPPATVISDPPYNVGYHYDEYDDALAADDYQELLMRAFRSPSVMLHYPEAIFAYAVQARVVPSRCASWVYAANTPRQHRMVAWFGCVPDFSLVKQPYKNQTDTRVRELMKTSEGANLYDWWPVQQVKNVSAEKVDHPCQIPVEVMKNIISITPAPLILDPFAGSGTTLVAAKILGRAAIGIEASERYCEMAAKRLAQNYFIFG